MFQSGMVGMSECVKHGFKPSTYTAEKSGDVWSFTTEQKSENEGTSSRTPKAA